MKIIGIDPGQYKSGYVALNMKTGFVDFALHLDNSEILNALRGNSLELSPVLIDEVAIEDIEAMGLTVGKATFETCAWRGRYQEAWEYRSEKPALLINRGDEKIVLCGTKTYVDVTTGKRKSITNSHIRKVLIDKFPQEGGGKFPSIGTKAKPGPLYYVKGDHCWSALAVIVTALQTHLEGRYYG